MTMEDDGFFSLQVPARAGERYSYVLDGGKAVPDPVSRLLPEGVHGPTEIVAPDAFEWTDQHWRGLEIANTILYELHTGTFTPEGDFDGVAGQLHYLKNVLGVTAIELMPVVAVPHDENGEARNWGYDGVSPYSVEATYGGPQGLKRLVNAAHHAGLAVVLDVVYNHLGNEGNYLGMFGPYFTDRHQTPWGNAINFDGPGSQEVRRYFIENALFWAHEYHMDGLRLDAVQTIHDDSQAHILREIKDHVQRFAEVTGRNICVIAETDANDSRMVRPAQAGGYGLDAFWSDDFHHALHTVLTGEKKGYYQDFGRLQQIARALQEGYVFQGEQFEFWGRPRGNSATDVPLYRNVICTQNHDQVGNRAQGERLTALTSWAQRRAAAALLLLSPHTPLLFMGEEFEAQTPFQFFSSFGDPWLKQAVRKGRSEEFKDFTWEEVPDPEDITTFERSKIQWPAFAETNEMLNWYRALIVLRKKLVMPNDRTCKAQANGGVLTMEVPRAQPLLRVEVNFDGKELANAGPAWKKTLFAADERCAVAVWEAA